MTDQAVFPGAANNRFNVEISRSATQLIFRRGRLFVTGEKIAVKPLPAVTDDQSKQWLSAIVSSKSVRTGTPWNLAHALAKRLKSETKANWVFVEPAAQNPGQSRFERLLLGSGEEQHALSKLLPQLTGNSTGNDPVATMVAKLVPNVSGNVLPGMHSYPTVPGFSAPPDEVDALKTHSKFSAEVDPFSESAQFSRETTFPLLHQLNGWSDVEASTQKMFEVEASQLSHRTSAKSESQTGDLLLHDAHHIALVLADLTNADGISTRLLNFLLGSRTA